MITYGRAGILLLILAATPINSKSQSFELLKTGSTITISGTSTLHDWKINLELFDCKANFSYDGSQLSVIDKVAFICKATDLKSEYSLMDKKTYAALQSKIYPEIKFNNISSIKITSGNNKFSGNMSGNLLIAGETNVVTIPFNGILQSNNGVNKINVRGSVVMKMSDFGVTPPVLMMGALKTGNEITVSFSLQFIQKSEQ